MKINRELKTGTTQNKITPKKAGVEKGPSDKVVLGESKGEAEFIAKGDELKNMKSYDLGDFLSDLFGPPHPAPHHDPHPPPHHDPHHGHPNHHGPDPHHGHHH